MSSKPIEQTYTIEAPILEVWKALVDPEIIKEWSDAPAKMSEEVGFEFELWNGDITGVNTTVEKPAKLVQEWQSGDWPKPSQVTITLKETDDHSLVTITQIGFPESERKDLEDGWNHYYFGAIEKYMETKD